MFFYFKNKTFLKKWNGNKRTFFSNNLFIKESLINNYLFYSSLNNLNEKSFICHSLTLNKSFLNMNLSKEGFKIFSTKNAGGSSIISETLSFEILKLLYNASLLKTELEISYKCCSKITDFSVKIGEKVLGVSVTRALKFYFPFDYNEGERLLKKKLIGIIDSSKNVCKKDKWEKQILHVFTLKENIKILIDVYTNLEKKIKANTIIIFSVCLKDYKTKDIF